MAASGNVVGIKIFYKGRDMESYTTNQLDERQHRYHLNTKEMSCVKEQKNFNIYLVDDDDDDLLFSENSLKLSERVADIHSFNNPEILFTQMKNHGLFKSEDLSLNDLPIILMDIHMPCVNGIEMLESLKSHPMTDEIPVVLLSSDVSGAKIHDAYRLRAHSYLKKPLNMKQFNLILDNILLNNNASTTQGDYLI